MQSRGLQRLSSGKYSRWVKGCCCYGLNRGGKEGKFNGEIFNITYHFSNIHTFMYLPLNICHSEAHLCHSSPNWNLLAACEDTHTGRPEVWSGRLVVLVRLIVADMKSLRHLTMIQSSCDPICLHNKGLVADQTLWRCCAPVCLQAARFTTAFFSFFFFFSYVSHMKKHVNPLLW